MFLAQIAEVLSNLGITAVTYVIIQSEMSPTILYIRTNEAVFMDVYLEIDM